MEPNASIFFRSAALMAILAMATVVSIAASPARATTTPQCRSIADPAARLRCYESLDSQGAGSLPASPRPSSSKVQMIGDWRLLRTPDPRGEKDVISITRGGEFYGSDPDFAGLMIRCADDGIDILLILLRPLSLGTQPRVSLNGKRFEGSVVPPGTIVSLPDEVTRAASRDWAALSDLSLVIDQSDTAIKGLVSLKGFDPALQALTAACSAR